MSKEKVVLPLGVNNIKGVNALRKFSNVDEFNYSGLWLFCGSQGFGKTLLMMSILRDIVRDYPNAIVVSNISIYGTPSFVYTGLSDFEKYNNGADGIIFVIDEIHTLFSSLESAKMPVEQIQVWAQNRKNRRLILGTSQRFNRIAKPIREQTKLLYQCYSPILWFNRYRCFDASCFDDNGNYSGDKERMVYYIPSFDTMTSYNTLEVVKRSKFTESEDK